MKIKLHFLISDFMFFPNRLFGIIAVVLIGSEHTFPSAFSGGAFGTKKNWLFNSTPLMVWVYCATKAMTSVQSKLVVFRLNCFNFLRSRRTSISNLLRWTEKVALIELFVTKLSYLIFISLSKQHTVSLETKHFKWREWQTFVFSFSSGLILEMHTPTTSLKKT